jgi:hypothetical protein
MYLKSNWILLKLIIGQDLHQTFREQANNPQLKIA